MFQLDVFNVTYQTSLTQVSDQEDKITRFRAILEDENLSLKFESYPLCFSKHDVFPQGKVTKELYQQVDLLSISYLLF